MSLPVGNLARRSSWANDQFQIQRSQEFKHTIQRRGGRIELEFRHAALSQAYGAADFDLDQPFMLAVALQHRTKLFRGSNRVTLIIRFPIHIAYNR